LKPAPGRASAGWVAPVFLINRLRNLAARQRHWTQPCETWEPVNGNVRPAFRSLAQHLVSRYAVPGFMDSVWDLPAGAEGFRQQSWYIRLGRGARAGFRAIAFWKSAAPSNQILTGVSTNFSGALRSTLRAGPCTTCLRLFPDVQRGGTMTWFDATEVVL
jgi:hypothetical protein